MVLKGQWHGNNIYHNAALLLWCYTEDDCPVEDDPRRSCKHCGVEATIEGHDACLGTLPGVKFACCGHGGNREAYISFIDGRKTIRHEEALEYITQAITTRNNNECTNGTSQNNRFISQDNRG